MTVSKAIPTPFARVRKQKPSRKEIELHFAAINAQSVIQEFRRNLCRYGPPKDGIIRVSAGVIELMLAHLKLSCPAEFSAAERAILEGRTDVQAMEWETYQIEVSPGLGAYDVDWGVKRVV